MSRRAVFGPRCLGAAVLSALSCARFGYESLPEGAFAPIPNDANVTRGGGLGGSAGSNGGADGGTADSGASGGAAAGNGGSGSTAPSSDAGDSGGTTTDSGAGGTGGALPGCGPGVVTAAWTFASDTEGWQLEADPGAIGTLSWTAATGDPVPGAVQIDATVVNRLDNVYLYMDQSPADFTTRVIYARVFLESGSGVSAKVYVQTGASAWGDGSEVFLQAQQWNCVSLDLQDPDVVTPGFDPTAVRRIGVFFFGDASPRLYVDQITY